MSSTQFHAPSPGPADAGRGGLLGCVDRIAGVLDDTEALDPLFLSPEEKREYLHALERAERRIQARKSAALATADEVAARAGARSAGALLAHETKVAPGRLRWLERLGKRLAEAYPRTGRGWLAGQLSPEHAAAVADSLDALPADIPGCETREARAEVLDRAEAELVKACAEFTPKQIRRLGRRILEVAAPEAADQVEQDLLEAEERKARRRTWLSLQRTGEGTTRLRGEIPDTAADLLKAALHAYTNPRRPDGSRDACSASSSTTGGGDATGELRTRTERNGDAFCALLEHLPAGRLPVHGGTPVSVIVTLDYGTLADGLGAATLNTGERLSATAVRRLACEHGIIPAVLDSNREVLDLGRTQRLFTAAQRRAHAIGHPECQAQGCEMPAAMCEAHHKNQPWAQGGTTNLKDLAFLCAHHHHRAHDPAYITTWNEAGEARFHRRQ